MNKLLALAAVCLALGALVSLSSSCKTGSSPESTVSPNAPPPPPPGVVWDAGTDAT